MNLRKGSANPTETFIPPDADCPLKEASSQRIPRLTVKAREHCLSLLQECLTNHRSGADHSLSSGTLSLAVEIEHEVFKSCKSANLYKAAVLKRVSELKKGTDDAVAPPGDEPEDACSFSEKDEEIKTTQKEAASSSTSSISEEQQGFTSASQVYSLKRKRVGAGFRGSSNPFQTAAELLKSSQNEIPTPQEPVHKEEEQDKQPENKRTKTSSSSSSSKTTTLSSPSKKAGKALSKKQQKLAEAAKDTHCISQYFGKKMDSSQRKEETVVSMPEEGGSTVPEAQECTSVSASPVDMNANTGNIPDSAMDVEKGTWDPKPVENHAEDASPMNVNATEEENIEDATTVPDFQSRLPFNLLYHIKQVCQGKESKGSRVGFCRPPTDTKRRVTFNPVLQEHKLEVDNMDNNQISHQPVTLKEAADIVVKILDPFYKKGKFATKDLFKSFARFLSHLLVEGKAKERGKEPDDSARLGPQ
ncbi:hypothetical protein NFI96_008480 [Prochilodus magdalenae]|nr:hypothetical protein NFI96_008480 [Prochilodus magdalenae]